MLRISLFFKLYRHIENIDWISSTIYSMALTFVICKQICFCLKTKKSLLFVVGGIRSKLNIQ